MGNSLSSHLGGVSLCYPRGTFVRVRAPEDSVDKDDDINKRLVLYTRKRDENEESEDHNQCEWDSNKAKLVGCIGLVVGGGRSAQDDLADVVFSTNFRGKIVGHLFKSAWLECVQDVAFGPAGTVVRVVSTPPTEKEVADCEWESGRYSNLPSQFGIVAVGVTGDCTLVSFPGPIYFSMVLADAWLLPASVTDVESEQEKENLIFLRDAVVEEFRKELASDFSDSDRMASIEMRLEKMQQAIDALTTELQRNNRQVPMQVRRIKIK